MQTTCTWHILEHATHFLNVFRHIRDIHTLHACKLLLIKTAAYTDFKHQEAFIRNELL